MTAYQFVVEFGRRTSADDGWKDDGMFIRNSDGFCPITFVVNKVHGLSYEPVNAVHCAEMIHVDGEAFEAINDAIMFHTDADLRQAICDAAGIA